MNRKTRRTRNPKPSAGASQQLKWVSHKSDRGETIYSAYPEHPRRYPHYYISPVTSTRGKFLGYLASYFDDRRRWVILGQVPTLDEAKRKCEEHHSGVSQGQAGKEDRQ